MKDNLFEKEAKLRPYFGDVNLVTREVIRSVMYPYFLQKTQEVQDKFRGHFEQHMNILTNYVLENYINSNNNLTIDLIKGFHKNLYSGINQVKVKTTGGEDEYMTPGEFKNKQNVISRLDKPGTFFVCTSPEEVIFQLQNLLEVTNEVNHDKIYESVFNFFLTFTEIHPFADDNGKIGMIFLDLILIKNGIYPIFLGQYKARNPRFFYESLQEYTHSKGKQLNNFYQIIGESYDYIYQTRLMANFYKDNHDIFLNYIKNTNEKEVLSTKIIDTIKNKLKNRDLTITNIGAGSGIVDRSIITYLRQNSIKFNYNYIEPSRSLIDYFALGFDCRDIVFYQGGIEDILLPKSDLIIVSHVLQYVDNLGAILNKVINSLNVGGIILIVQQSNASADVILKEKIGYNYSMNLERIFKILGNIKESFFVEKVNSELNNLDDIIKLNKNGKDLISFFYNKPFEIINSDEIKNIQDIASELGVGGKILKQEDYIWITK